MKKIILFVSLAGLLAGCASPAQRMAECQASIMNAAEKQALENASKAVK